jgi:glycosyltransferase involved in cell wall biosynthesis
MVQVWGITMIANEGDIIEYTLRHMLNQGLDGIIVANNLSTDNTPDILDALQAEKRNTRLIVMEDTDPAHRQGKKMTRLARFAKDLSGEADLWIIPFDADELWIVADQTENLSERVRKSSSGVIGVPMWNHFCTNQDGENKNPFIRMCFKNIERNALDKVAYRYTPYIKIGDGNHAVSTLSDRCIPGRASGLEIRHFPYRGEDHFIRKIDRGGRALELATELDVSIGGHWRQYRQSLIEHGEEAMKEHYRKYFTFTVPCDLMHLDPAPYQGGK